MLTRAQFVQALTQANRSIYLGGPSRIHRQSSMLPLVNAVHAYEGAANPANLLAVYLAIDNVPQVKKLRYAQAIAGLQDSMGGVKVTANPLTVHPPGTAVNGIGVPKSNAKLSHQTDAVLALRQLEQLASGQALIVAICNQVGVNGKQVSVQPWDGQQTNKCEVAAAGGNDGDNAKTNLALALEMQHGNAGAVINSCLTILGHAPPAGYTWPQHQVNNAPLH